MNNKKIQSERLLIEEIQNIKEAGDLLAEASHRVQSTFDGIHRLRLALSNWYKVRANEYGRDKSEI